MEPLRRWNRLGGVLAASHSTLMRLSPAPPADEVGEVERSARPGASWTAVWFWSWSVDRHASEWGRRILGEESWGL